MTDPTTPSATHLHTLFERYGQSPWLDDLTRGYLTGGELSRWVSAGIRGVTSNPTIFQRAIAGSGDYDQQFADLTRSGCSVEEAYWQLVTDDIAAALAVLRPVYDASGGADGFVSVEVAPDLAHDTAGTVAAARALHDRIGQPNLFVKVPATTEGVAAIQQLVAEGRSINVTLVFGLSRYAEVIEAYLTGLEQLAVRDPHADQSRVPSVASFFVSRVDTVVDRRLAQLGTSEADELRGRAAIAQAQLAYQLFTERFAGPRWDALVARGARVQRPLWASTSIKDPSQPDTRYVDELIGPDTVTTMPPATVAAVVDHGTPRRTVDRDVAGAHDVLDRLVKLGIDLDEVSATLEAEGVSSFSQAYSALSGVLAAKATTSADSQADGPERSNRRTTSADRGQQ